MVREFAKIGVRLKKDKTGTFNPWQSEVYDVESGKCLPAVRASIVIDPESPVRAVVTLDLAEVEIVNEV